MTPFEEAALILRGWAESKTRLRVVLRSPQISFSSFCTVCNAENDRFAFWIESEDDKNAIDFFVGACVFDFRDSPTGEEEILGEKVLSALVALRQDFELLTFLLKETDSMR